MRLWRRWSRAWPGLLVLALALVAACSSNNASKTPTPVRTQVQSGATGTAAPAVASATVPATSLAGLATPTAPAQASGTPAGGTPAAALDPCSQFPNGPLAGTPATSAALISGGSPQPDATQTARPAVNLSASAFTVPDSYMPQGFTRFGDQQIGISNIVTGTADPQASAAFLQEVGFAGGRQQNWGGPLIQQRYPIIFVQDLVFGTDAGASKFLRSPLFGASLCIHAEPAPALGMEAAGFYYQYIAPTAAPNNQAGPNGPFDGHADLVRCGRVVLNVTASGAPGEFTKSYVDGLTKQIVALLATSQPCS
ncbi:MAG TPA: hypothetical protein VFA70_10015 [Dehalococcoidia bacterium]|nr:hypothetical protein [Dehalococcoidia bacterium]